MFSIRSTNVSIVLHSLYKRLECSSFSLQTSRMFFILSANVPNVLHSLNVPLSYTRISDVRRPLQLSPLFTRPHNIRLIWAMFCSRLFAKDLRLVTVYCNIYFLQTLVQICLFCQMHARVVVDMGDCESYLHRAVSVTGILVEYLNQRDTLKLLIAW